MDSKVLIAFILAIIWGVVWACFLQVTKAGQFLVHRRTWLAVVVGVGMDEVILLVCLPWNYWITVATVITLSSVGIIVRSLFNEWVETNEVIRAVKDSLGQQDDLGAGGFNRSLPGRPQGLAAGHGPSRAPDGPGDGDGAGQDG